MKKLILLSLVVSCSPDPDFETHQGMRIFSLNGIPTQEMIESSCAATVFAMKGTGWKAFEGLTLNVQDEPFDLGDVGYVNGFYSHVYFEIGITMTNKCLARTAFVHELIHMFQWTWEQNDDYLHEDRYWWGWQGIEARAQNFAILNECPEEGPEWVDPETNVPVGGW